MLIVVTESRSYRRRDPNGFWSELDDSGGSGCPPGPGLRRLVVCATEKRAAVSTSRIDYLLGKLRWTRRSGTGILTGEMRDRSPGWSCAMSVVNEKRDVKRILNKVLR
ncbi:hypothetical protein Zmor_009640 [Zophobas morio]|uniref:Uncharacterized protein n=1 Tax=Zophobas morio TaxID=2755281 RepID=A0AA38MJ23_9CUCU|nr:hypothetical protein Zmor_009640 [Zophobas morio]